MTTAWHVDDAALARWVDGTDGSVAGASVEQHLLACAECRGKVPVDPVVDLVWARVQDEVVLPRATFLERLLRRTGLPEADARIVAVSPAFRAAWLVGLAVLLAFVTVAGAQGTRFGAVAFLLVAPLVPSLAVALGYDPEFDDALEQETATSYSRLRLVLLRSAALLVIAAPALGTVSVFAPGHRAFLWLAPAAGCTALVLALSTWVTPLTAVGAVATGWLVVVSAVARSAAVTTVLDRRHVAAYAIATVVGIVVVVLRRGRLSVITWGDR